MSRVVARLLQKFLSVPENSSKDIGNPKSILLVRQHNQFGDMLAGVSLFRAIKESFPQAKLTVLVSPENSIAITKNKYIDTFFIFNKKKLLSPVYFFRLKNLLKTQYDLCIIPSTVSISHTSLLLGRLSNSAIRIGPSALNGEKNKYKYLHDRHVVLDWRKFPDSHVSDFGLEIVRPFGISTNDFRSGIEFDRSDIKEAKRFIRSLKWRPGYKLIGIHAGAGKPKNRWSLDKYISVITKLSHEYHCRFFLTGSSSDENELNYIQKNLNLNIGVFLNRKIPELAALISMCDLFITNDTGVMHVAGATDVPQISIFGPTNPFNWAPIGQTKYFIRKSDLIDDVTVDNVVEISRILLK